MEIKLTVLSGSRQNTQILLEQPVITVGESEADTIRFNSTDDPAVRGQRLKIELQQDRWKILNNSKRPVFINQSLVRDSSLLQFGDLIRLSVDGPDLLFEQSETKTGRPQQEEDCTIELETPSPADHSDDRLNPRKETSPLSADHCASGLEIGSEVDEIDSVAPAKRVSQVNLPPSNPSLRHNSGNRRSKRKRSKLAFAFTVLAILSGGIAGICIAIVMLWVIWQKDPLGIIQPDVTATEMLQNQGSEETELPVSKIPQGQGMESSLSPTTDGQERNSPSRAQAVQARPKVRETGGLLKPITPRNATIGTRVELELAAFVSESITEPVVFGETGESPAGVEIDHATGFLSWSIPNDAKQGITEIPFKVSLLNKPEVNAESTIVFALTEQVIPKPPAQPIRHDAIYLITAKTSLSDRFFPLGMACGVGPKRLLTSGAVVTGIEMAETQGWEVVALNSQRLAEGTIEEHQLAEQFVHRIYSEAANDTDNRKRERVFFDIGWIRTNEEIPTTIKLSTVPSDGIGDDCLVVGYPILGDSVADPTSMLIVSRQSELNNLIPYEESSIWGPKLLQLNSDIPGAMFGSPIFNSTAEIIGVFGYSEIEDGDEARGVTYGCDVLSMINLLSDPEENEDYWRELSMER